MYRSTVSRTDEFSAVVVSSNGADALEPVWCKAFRDADPTSTWALTSTPAHMPVFTSTCNRDLVVTDAAVPGNISAWPLNNR